MTANPVTISYKDLQSPTPALYPLIKEAFSSDPSCLGLLVITDLPAEWAELRSKLLHFADEFAALPDAIKNEYADATQGWNHGWSHGREIMNGKQDFLKGSFYVNPTSDVSPPLTAGEKPGHNLWPDETKIVPGYQATFKALTKIMLETGYLLAAACDQALVAGATDALASTKTVEQLIRGSNSHKARLLHYFATPGVVFDLPPSSALSDTLPHEEIDDSWCGVHVDHSILTGLCPAMYLFHPSNLPDAEPLVIPSPSHTTGLYIKTRAGETLRATIPNDCMAFQTGETLEVLSDKALAATPHFVNGTATTLGKKALQAIEAKKAADPAWKDVSSGTVTRETLALFMQPDSGDVISKTGLTFGQFSRKVIDSHY